MDSHEPGLNVQLVIDWLIDGAKPARNPKDALHLLCQRMLECGLRLHRVAIFVRPLHPNVAARALYWREGSAGIEVGTPAQRYCRATSSAATRRRYTR